MTYTGLEFGSLSLPACLQASLPAQASLGVQSHGFRQRMPRLCVFCTLHCLLIPSPPWGFFIEDCVFLASASVGPSLPLQVATYLIGPLLVYRVVLLALGGSVLVHRVVCLALGGSALVQRMVCRALGGSALLCLPF